MKYMVFIKTDSEGWKSEFSSDENQFKRNFFVHLENELRNIKGKLEFIIVKSNKELNRW